MLTLFGLSVDDLTHKGRFRNGGVLHFHLLNSRRGQTKVLVPAIEKAVNATKAKIDQMGDICEYKSPAELTKLRDDEYKQMYDIAVKMGLRKP